MFENLFNLFSKVPKGISLQFKFRKNKNGQEMVYIYLDGFINDKYVNYERKIGLKNAIKSESDIIKEIIESTLGNI